MSVVERLVRYERIMVVSMCQRNLKCILSRKEYNMN